MPEYVVFVVDDDADTWESASEEVKNRTYAADARFATLLEERGARIKGGADLSHPRETRVLTRDAGGAAVATEGPFAETVEQLSGFYVVEADDVETVVEAAKAMLDVHTRLEIRPRPVEVGS